MLAGITGPSGAGKSEVVKVFADKGFEVIDADMIAREVVMPGGPALLQLAGAFGADVILPDGSLDRRLLASRAFASPEHTRTLVGITHPAILITMRERAENARLDGRNCLFDAPLLIEAGLDGMCDVRIAVVAPEEIRIKRLLRRDGISEDGVRARISRQHDDGFYTQRCDYVIVNDGGIDALRNRAAIIADEIIRSHSN